MFKYMLITMLTISTPAYAEVVSVVKPMGTFAGCENVVDQEVRERVFLSCVDAAFKEGMAQNTKYNDAAEVVQQCRYGAESIAYREKCNVEKKK